MQKRELDLIVWGATGFTGKLVAEYLAKRCGPSGKTVHWALAGRSESKLSAVMAELNLPEDTPMVVANADDPASMNELARRAQVVLTTVGPYQLYGGHLLEACAAQGTHYVDLCGEPNWMHTMIGEHSSKAAESGARIVFSCGFDSVPFDLGVYFLQQQAISQFGKPLSRVRGRVRDMRGTFSGGTIASFNATMAAAKSNPAVFAVLTSPYSLTPHFQGPEQPSGAEPVFDAALDSWAAPFFMAPINTKNIHRSNKLMNHRYGTDFLYDEMVLTGSGEKGEARALAMTENRSMKGSDRKPGEGPDKEERETGYYDLIFHGESAAGESLTATVYGDKDPGYGSTSKMISECALQLVENPDLGTGGIWTPAPIFGDALVDALGTNAGVSFDLVTD